MAGEGRDQIGALIAAVHERFPGFRFTLDGRVDGYRDRIRFSWALGPETEADVIKGTDFVVVEGGPLKSITGFLDKVPNPASAQHPTSTPPPHTPRRATDPFHA